MKSATGKTGYRLVLQLIEEKGSSRTEILHRELAVFPQRKDGKDAEQYRWVATDCFWEVASPIERCESAQNYPGAYVPPC